MRLYQSHLNTPNTDTRFVYDGLEAIMERNESNVIQRRFVFGPGIDEPLVWYEGSGTTDRRWLHADERGSVIAVSDASGAATQINRYDEFGIPQAGNAGRFQYTGQAWLPELLAYNYKARMYEPRLGRFLQPDPIGYAAGMNRYAYVGNDPVNWTDPSGQFWIFIVGALSGAAITYGTQVVQNYASGQSGYSAWANVNSSHIAVGATMGAMGAAGLMRAAVLGKAKFVPFTRATIKLNAAERAAAAALASIGLVTTVVVSRDYVERRGGVAPGLGGAMTMIFTLIGGNSPGGRVDGQVISGGYYYDESGRSFYIDPAGNIVYVDEDEVPVVTE